MKVATEVGSVRARAFTDTALLWLTLGLYVTWHVGAHVDAWYHVHYGFAIESFATRPHFLLYAGVAGTGLVVALYLLESLALHEPRAAWLPRGFPMALFGAVLFLLGGGFDLVWHSLFGFEANLEVLFTPPHLLFVAAGASTGFGLFRAGLERRRREGPPAARGRALDVPMLLSLAILFRVVLWSFFYSEPSAIDYASAGAHAHHLPATAGIVWANMAARIAGATGIILHTVLLALFLVVPLRRLRLPRGAIAALVGWDALLVAAVTDMWLYLPAALAAAVTGELIWARMWRGALGGLDGEVGYWTLGAAVPAVQFLVYFVLMAAFGGGITWATHLWVGAAVMAGLYGFLTSLLAVPPRFVRAER